MTRQAVVNRLQPIVNFSISVFRTAAVAQILEQEVSCLALQTHGYIFGIAVLTVRAAGSCLLVEKGVAGDSGQEDTSFGFKSIVGTMRNEDEVLGNA